MAKFEKRKQARVLRRHGHSLKAIAADLGVAKSSVSLWCRDIKLSESQIDSLLKDQEGGSYVGRLKGAEANRRKKEARLQFCRLQAEENFIKVTKKQWFYMGVALYWAEGSKTGRVFSFSNSDPAMIKFIQLWLEKVWGVSREDLLPRILINQIHAPRINKVLQFWSSLLELPTEQFRKTTFVQTNNKKIYDNHDQYFGVLVLRVRKSSSLVDKIVANVSVLQDLAKSG